MGELSLKRINRGKSSGLNSLIGTGIPVLRTTSATSGDSPSYWTVDEGGSVTYTPVQYFSKNGSSVLYSSDGVPIYAILYLDIYNLSNMNDGINEWSAGIIAPAIYGKEVTTRLNGIGTEYEVTTRFFDSETETTYGHSYCVEVTFSNISNDGYSARVSNQTLVPYIGEWTTT